MAARRVLSSLSLLRATSSAAHSSASPLLSARALLGAGDGTEQRSSAGAWLLGCAAGAAAMSAGAAQAEGSTAIPPEGKITVQTDSGKHTILYPAGDNEWRIKISPAVPAHEPPPKPPVMTGPVQLTPPPYSLSALEPQMTRETLETHWGKHHKTYAENANKQLAQLPELSQVAEKDIIEALKVAWQDGKPLPVFNNIAQTVNHTMFWESMRPQGGGEPPANSKLSAAIQRDFGSFKALEEELKSAALTQFGSGWAWLVCDAKGNLKVFKTGNAINPIVTGWIPILALDVWEHAYYIEYKNRRNEYVQNFFEHLVDWDGAALRYEAAQELA